MEQDQRDQSASEEIDKDWPGGLPWVASCLYGSLFAAVADGLIVGFWPKSTQIPVFLGSFIVLAPVFSVVGHWLFITRPHQVAQKLEDEEASDENSEDAGDYSQDVSEDNEDD